MDRIIYYRLNNKFYKIKKEFPFQVERKSFLRQMLILELGNTTSTDILTITNPNLGYFLLFKIGMLIRKDGINQIFVILHIINGDIKNINKNK